MVRVLMTLVFILFVSCSKNREVVEVSRSSDLTIAVALDGEATEARATLYSKIYILIYSSDGTVVVDTAVNTAGNIQFVTIEDIVEGTNYTAVVWTEDVEGDTIHNPVFENFTIQAEKQTTITVTLSPRCGSILFQLVDLPTNIDSLYLQFVSDSGTFATEGKRSKSMFLSLDKVPYGSIGTLSFAMLSANKDTVSQWDTLFTFVNQEFSIEFSLINNGDLITEVNVEKPSTSIFSAIGDTTVSLKHETGELVISEFCVTGGSGSSSKEFIEIYNPSNLSYMTDSLIVTTGSKSFVLTDFTLDAQSYYSIAASQGYFWYSDTTLAVDMSSTSGMLSLKSDGELLDYLIYFNDEDAGWEKLSSSAHQSWVLNSEKLTAALNNSGGSWLCSTSEVVDSTGSIWYGTPGSSGR